MILVRVVANEKGAFGVLVCGGECFAVTVEHVYPGGEIKIPAGVYPCRRRMFFRGGYETFEILVPGHQDILFHIANFAREVDGCIGVAESYKEFGDAFGAEPGVADSKGGFAEFKQLTAGLQTFDLRVVDVTKEVFA